MNAFIAVSDANATAATNENDAISAAIRHLLDLNKEERRIGGPSTNGGIDERGHVWTNFKAWFKPTFFIGKKRKTKTTRRLRIQAERFVNISLEG
ncbi:hypothetical protein V7S43_002318 [Phytophthora oleae]|uniref:Uncharacterized protein n=1 Tax=Phytophthora oleae TaxID=2107226 RepID=A0ABD3G368_9STRA